MVLDEANGEFLKLGAVCRDEGRVGKRRKVVEGRQILQGGAGWLWFAESV